MGRPLNKRYFGKDVGDIQISSWRRSTGTESNDAAYIVRQRSKSKFTVSAYDDSWQENLFLVDKPAGSLEPGEFRVEVQIDNDITEVDRIFSRVVVSTDSTRRQWSTEQSILVSNSQPLVGPAAAIDVHVDQATLGGLATQIIIQGGTNFVLLGQSELHRLVLSAHATLGTAGVVNDENALRIWWYDLTAGEPTGVRVDEITNANKVSAWMVDMSNALAELAPGTQFNIAFLTKAGTGLDSMLDNNNLDRDWSDTAPGTNGDKEVFDRFKADLGFTQPDAVFMSWQNTDSTLLTYRLADAWWGALTETQPDGTPIARGSTVYNTTYDNFFTDLWDPTIVPTVFLMHRYDVLNASDQADYDRFRDVRVSIDRMVDSSYNRARNLPFERGVDPVAYRNPVTDQSHAEKSEFGASILSRMLAYNIVRRSSLAQTINPMFDTIAWNRDRVVLRSNAGDVTTRRIIDGDPRPVGQPEIAQLFFRAAEAPSILRPVAEGQVVLDATGVVRIEAAGLLASVGVLRTQFQGGDSLEFAPAGSGNNDIQDFTDDTWRDYPVVVDSNGYQVPIQPMSGASVCDLPETPLTNLYDGNLAEIAGATLQNDGWMVFSGTEEIWENRAVTGLSTGTEANTIFVDIDREEGTTRAAGASASFRVLDDGNSQSQTMTVGDLWGEVSLSAGATGGAVASTNFGAIALENGRVRVWMRFNFSNTGNMRVILNSSNNGGAYAQVGIYGSALTSAQVAAQPQHVYLPPVVVTANAVADSASTEQNTAVVIDPLANDTGPGITIVAVSTPTNGNATITGAGTTITYTPNTDYFGQDSLTYTIEDSNGVQSVAAITITVTEILNEPTTFFTLGAAGTWFVQPANPGAGITRVERSYRLRINTTPAASSFIATQTSTGFDLVYTATPSLRLTIEDGAGVKGITNHIVQTPQAENAIIRLNRWVEVSEVMDWQAGTEGQYTITIDGVTMPAVDMLPAATTKEFQLNRPFSMFANAAGASGLPNDTDFEYFQYIMYDNTGTEIENVRVDVANGLAAANAHPWKQGADLTIT